MSWHFKQLSFSKSRCKRFLTYNMMVSPAQDQQLFRILEFEHFKTFWIKQLLHMFEWKNVVQIWGDSNISNNVHFQNVGVNIFMQTPIVGSCVEERIILWFIWTDLENLNVNSAINMTNVGHFTHSPHCHTKYQHPLKEVGLKMTVLS